MDDAVLRRLEALKAWRKKMAEQMGVESDIILPRPYLLSLAERGGRDLRVHSREFAHRGLNNMVSKY